MKKIGIIPARGDSKGLPRKNIRNLCGKPLIHWTIEQAVESEALDEIFVSTDDSEIMEVANKLGKFCPELRPKELARDESKTIDVISYTKEKFFRETINPIIVLLEPTSPLRESTDIKNGLKIFLEKCGESLVSISRTESQNPAFLFKIDEDKKITPITGCYPNSLRRQDISSCYFIEGTLYISEYNALIRNKGFLSDNTIGFEVPKWKSIEIDDIYDFVSVEAIIKLRKTNYEFQR